MPQTVVESLQDWMQSMRSNLVFPSRNNTVLCNVDNDFREVIDELGLNDDVVENKDRLVFHSLETHLCQLPCKRGYTEMQLAKLLGHRSTEMTRRYTHLMPETQREAAQGMWKRFSKWRIRRLPCKTFGQRPSKHPGRFFYRKHAALFYDKRGLC